MYLHHSAFYCTHCDAPHLRLSSCFHTGRALRINHLHLHYQFLALSHRSSSKYVLCVWGLAMYLTWIYWGRKCLLPSQLVSDSHCVFHSPRLSSWLHIAQAWRTCPHLAPACFCYLVFWTEETHQGNYSCSSVKKSWDWNDSLDFLRANHCILSYVHRLGAAFSAHTVQLAACHLGLCC